jgi:hypothetical protein
MPSEIAASGGRAVIAATGHGAAKQRQNLRNGDENTRGDGFQ